MEKKEVNMAPRPKATLSLVVMLCILGALMVPGLARGAASGTVDIRVSGGNDDAEERLNDGAVDRGSLDLQLIRDGGIDQIVGPGRDPRLTNTRHAKRSFPAPAAIVGVMEARRPGVVALHPER